MKKTTKSSTSARRQPSKRSTQPKGLLSRNSPLCQSLTKTTNCDLIILVAVLAVLCVFAWFYFALIGQADYFTPSTITPDSPPAASDKIDPNQLAMEQVSGDYLGRLPGADLSERSIELKLDSTGIAEFIKRRDDLQSISTEAGTWTLIDGEITIYLTPPQTLSFAVGDTTLSLINYNQDEWGTRGLTLIKQDASTTATPTSNCTAANLGSCPWVWQGTDGNDTGNLLVPTTPGSFVLTFNEADGTVNIKTDCNGGRTTYALDGVDPLTFAPIISTQKFCQGSQETQFIRDLSQVTDYLLTQQNLALTTSDGKVMTFSAQ